MGTYNSAVITNGGQSMIAQAVAGASLEFTTIKTSSYAYPAGTNLATLTTINGIKQSKDITSATVYNSRVIKISAAVDNTGISTAYTINTIGIYAKVGSSAESLFAVVTASAADTMPAYNNKPYSYIYEINLTMQNAENVTVTVNAAGLVNVADLNTAKVEIQGEIADLKSELSLYNSYDTLASLEYDIHANKGITYSKNGNEITANGTCESDRSSYATLFNDAAKLPDGLIGNTNYTCAYNTSDSNVWMEIYGYDNSGIPRLIHSFTSGSASAVINFGDYIGALIRSKILPNTTVSNATFSCSIISAPTNKELKNLIESNAADIDTLNTSVNTLNTNSAYNAKNLLEMPSTATINGITFTVSGSEIKVNGTATNGANFVLLNSPTSLPSWAVEGNEYAIELGRISDFSRIVFQVLAYTAPSTFSLIYLSPYPGKFTIPSGTIGLVIRLHVDLGTTIDNSVLMPYVGSSFSQKQLSRNDASSFVVGGGADWFVKDVCVFGEARNLNIVSPRIVNGVAAVELYTSNGDGGNVSRLMTIYASGERGFVSTKLPDGTRIELYIDGTYANSVPLSYEGLACQLKHSCFVPLKSAVEDIINKQHFSSNMVDETDNLPPYAVYADNGSTSDLTLFGQDDVRYVFTLPNYKKLHYAFDYQWTAPVPYYGEGDAYYTGLTSLTSGNIKAVEWLFGGIASLNYYGRKAFEGLANPSIVKKQTNNHKFKSSIGPSAFSVRTTLDPTATANQDIVLRFEKTNHVLIVKHTTTNTEIGRATYADSDTVDSLIASLNNISGIECEALETSGHTCGELLFIGAGNIPLVSYYSTPQKYDAHTVYIPYALDTEWHNIEVIIDEDSNKGYIAFDGWTFETTLGAISSNRKLEIGGIINISALGYPVSPVRIRNLVIDVNSYGGAEIVQHVAAGASSQTPVPQLISNKNPRLIIYEGHGIDIGADADGIVISDMSVSTDRLRVVMDALEAKGYKPVRWEDVIEWKINNKPLPKRSYVMMFDDWRFENFIDYRKRIPFTHKNVMAGLAVISDQYSRSETMTINGESYTVGEIVDITTRQGWYPCSHTKDHRRMNTFTPTELDELFRQDVLSADRLGIYSNVLVYPYGEINISTYISLSHSAFAIGVIIASSDYNCRGNTDYYLTRVEIGKRVTLADVLASVV